MYYINKIAKNQPQNAMLEQLPADWQAALAPHLDEPTLLRLQDFLQQERKTEQVFPPEEKTFAALHLTPVATVKALLLGQDPYHDEGQACGLAFSVPDNIPAPPSLRNILREYCQDLGFPMPRQNSLEKWARQGVLLLNTVLTVRAHQPGSHRGMGWEHFTDAVIKALARRNTSVVFLLWGKQAWQKKKLITSPQHIVLTAPHPSPLSAYRGFFGAKPFSQCNAELLKRQIDPIDWRLN